QERPQIFELYSAPLAGGAAATRLSLPLNRFRGVLAFALSADGTHAAFTAGDPTDGYKLKVFSAPLDGSSGALALSAALSSPGSFSTLLVSPDGLRVVYRADPSGPLQNELFSAPMDGSQPAVRLNAPLA